MKLEIHEDEKGIYVRRWVSKKYRWRNVAGPYKNIGNARVGLRLYSRNNEESFDLRVGRQVMALKNWGDVKL